jgi:hypothetical protein
MAYGIFGSIAFDCDHCHKQALMSGFPEKMLEIIGPNQRHPDKKITLTCSNCGKEGSYWLSKLKWSRGVIIPSHGKQTVPQVP